MNIDEMKNKISMELKNPITQQGFEIICKHLIDKDNSIKKLIADMAGLEEELTEKDKQIDYAKSIIKSLLDNSDEYAEQRAREFLKE